MKIIIIASLIAFIAAVGATMFFTGFFDKKDPQMDVSIESEKVGTSDEGEKEPGVKTMAGTGTDGKENESNIANTGNNLQKEISTAKLELEKYKAQIAAEEAKLAAIKSEVEALNNTKSAIDKGKQMAKLYAAMKPNEAALVLCELDENTTKQILSGMDNRTAGKIMSAMAATNPSYVASISKTMVNSNSGTKAF